MARCTVERMTVLAFTGHRPDKLGGYKDNNPIAKAVKVRMATEAAKLKPERVISGMALGVDTWAAIWALDNCVPLTAAIPFVGQESNWPRESRERYEALLLRAATVTIVSAGRYSHQKMQKRNEWMVDNCDALIAVYIEGASGGTHNCVQYAYSRGRKVIAINPSQFFGL